MTLGRALYAGMADRCFFYARMDPGTRPNGERRQTPPLSHEAFVAAFKQRAAPAPRVRFREQTALIGVRRILLS